MQVSLYTANVPLQIADLPPQFPELADTDTSVYIPASGAGQIGAPIHVRLVAVTDVPLLPTQVTVGGVIVESATPIAGTVPQLSVYVIELLLGRGIVLELEFKIVLELDFKTELELGSSAGHSSLNCPPWPGQME